MEACVSKQGPGSYSHQSKLVWEGVGRVILWEGPSCWLSTLAVAHAPVKQGQHYWTLESTGQLKAANSAICPPIKKNYINANQHSSMHVLQTLPLFWLCHWGKRQESGQSSRSNLDSKFHSVEKKPTCIQSVFLQFPTSSTWQFL